MRTTHKIYLGGVVGYWAIVTVALASIFLGSCAAFKKDVVAVADVCRPEVMPDAIAALPYVGVLIMCSATHTDCTSALAELKALGKADAVQCAIALSHEATVQLAQVDAGAQ